MTFVSDHLISSCIDRYGWQTWAVASATLLPLKFAYQKFSDQTRSHFFSKIVSPIEYYLGECLTIECDVIKKIKSKLLSSKLAEVLSIKVTPNVDLSTHEQYGLPKEKFTNLALTKLSQIETKLMPIKDHVLERINLLLGIIYHPLFSENHAHAPIINQIFTDCLENLKLNEADMIASKVFPQSAHRDAAHALAIDKMLLRKQFDDALIVIFHSKMSITQKCLSYRNFAEELFKTKDKKNFDRIVSKLLMIQLGLDAFKWVVETKVIKNKQIDLKKMACNIGFQGPECYMQNLPPKTFENGMSVKDALEFIKRYDSKLDIEKFESVSVAKRPLLV